MEYLYTILNPPPGNAAQPLNSFYDSPFLQFENVDYWLENPLPLERKDLTTGQRAYRLPMTATDYLRSDPILGYYITVGRTRYYLSPIDPTVGVKCIRDWNTIVG